MRARWKAAVERSGFARRSPPVAHRLLTLVSLWVLGLPANAFASARCTERLTMDWRFNAAAPLTDSAAVSADGWVVVSSVDGYVHALDASGHFQWSYTLDAPAYGIAMGADARTYALSREGVLHVMLPSGQFHWGGRLPSGMLPTGLPAHSERGVVYVPSELNLYAFSASSGLMWRAFVGSPITSGPLVDPDGDAWVTARGRVLRIRSPQQRSEFGVAKDAGTKLVSAGRSRVLLQVNERDKPPALVAYDVHGKQRWRRENVAASSDAGHIVRGAGGAAAQWTWLASETGRVLGERELDLDVAASPAEFDRFAVVPTNAGRVYVFDDTGSVEWCQVSTAPLLSARVHQKSGRVIAAAGDGWVAAVRFRDTAAARSGLPHQNGAPREDTAEED